MSDLTQDENRWEVIMADATLGGVTFPLAKRALGGGLDFGRIRPIGRAGQGVEPTGRHPLTFTLEIPLFNGVEQRRDLYPTVYEELIDVFTNDVAAGPVDYTDPILGSFRVTVPKWDADETAERRDGAVITCQLEEADESDDSFVVPARSPGREAIARAAAMDAGLAGLGANDTDVLAAIAASGYPRSGDERWSSGALMSGMTSGFLGDLQAGALTADQVGSRVDAYRSRIRSVVLGIEAVGTALGWDVYAAGMMLVDAAGALGERALASAAPVQLVRINGSVSAADLALRLYRDPARADDIIRRAPVARPWAYEAGTVLRLPSR